MAMAATNPPVRPRDAASLVIYRQQGAVTEVLLGRRSLTARFKPGIYVFPGGGLEADDSRVQASSALDAAIVPKLAVAGSHLRASALALASIRETYEECGLMIGEAGDIGPSRSRSWQAFRAAGLAPPLAPLSYLGRAITPSPQPIRFHARFFAISADYAHGSLAASTELSELQWVPLAEAAALEVMNVTLLMLEALTRRLHLQDPRAAFLSIRRGQRKVQWA